MMFACQSALGQDSVNVRRFDYAISIYTGLQGINSKDLNHQLQVDGIDQLSQTAKVFGTSATSFWNRFGFGSSVDFLSIKSSSAMSRYATMLGFNYGIHLTYYVVERPSFTFYPVLELRSATMYVRTVQRSNYGDINDVLTQPSLNTTIRYSTAMLTLSVGLSSRRPIKNWPWTCPQSDRYLSFDLKAGYNFTVASDHGTYNGAKLPDGPTLTYNGPYVKVGFGFGTRLRRMNWN